MSPNQIPQLFQVRARGSLDADRHAHHPAAVELRWAHERFAGLVDGVDPAQGVLVERFPVQTRRLVSDADGLQFDGCEYLPVFLLGHLLGKPLRVLQIAAQAFADRIDAIDAEVVPELERTKASTERNALVAILFDFGIDRRAQVAGISGHHAYQVLHVANVKQRTIEDRTHPFVRVPRNRVGRFDPFP